MARNDYDRPILLTIIAVLMILIGILTLIGGLLMILGGTALSVGGDSAGLIAGAGGIIAVISGLLFAVVGFGLFSGKAWAWWLAIIVMAIQLILGILSLQLWNVIIALLVLFYLTRGNTKGWFGV